MFEEDSSLVSSDKDPAEVDLLLAVDEVCIHKALPSYIPIHSTTRLSVLPPAPWAVIRHSSN